MENSETYGMQTFDMALLGLFKEGKISEEEALKNADSPNNLRLKLRNTKSFSSTSSFELEVEADPEDEDDEEGVDENIGQVFERS